MIWFQKSSVIDIFKIKAIHFAYHKASISISSISKRLSPKQQAFIYLFFFCKLRLSLAKDSWTQLKSILSVTCNRTAMQHHSFVLVLQVKQSAFLHRKCVAHAHCRCPSHGRGWNKSEHNQPHWTSIQLGPTKAMISKTYNTTFILV